MTSNGHWAIDNKSTRSNQLAENISEYDKDISLSHTADQQTEPRGRDTRDQQSQDIRKTNKVKQPALSYYQYDCQTIKDTK